MIDRECEWVRASIFLVCEAAFPGIVFSVNCQRIKWNEPIEVKVIWHDGPNHFIVSQIVLKFGGPRFYECCKHIIECKVRCERKISKALSAHIKDFVERVFESSSHHFRKVSLTKYRRKWSTIGYPAKRFQWIGILRS